MNITFLGAAGGEVTGSSYLVETGKSRVLIDCGMFQSGSGTSSKNRPNAFGFARKLDAVLLTHAHLDHTGRLPLLPQTGYKGPIFATPATIDLTGLILRDSAKIQAQDIERENRKRQRAGKDPAQPLYTQEQTEEVLSLLRPIPYHQKVDVADGITAFFAEAGHMLGSSSIQLDLENDGTKRTVIFSGDLGPKGAPILKDYEPFKEADVVLLESTYGDREHRAFRDTVVEFFEIVKEAVKSKGKILVPTFAVGRAQLLTMLMAYAFRNQILPPFPVYLDSPMAIEAWNIYRGHTDLFDEEMSKFLREGSVQHDLATFKASRTADESKAINEVSGPCLIMAGAGMCTAGRILHHFKQNLWKPENHVLIVGYQAKGSLGRMLVEGVNKVKIFGEEVAVRARVHTLGGFSAHAGQTDLLHWFKPLSGCHPKLILTHGETAPRAALAAKIAQLHGIQSLLPSLNEVAEL